MNHICPFFDSREQWDIALRINESNVAEATHTTKKEEIKKKRKKQRRTERMSIVCLWLLIGIDQYIQTYKRHKILLCCRCSLWSPCMFHTYYESEDENGNLMRICIECIWYDLKMDLLSINENRYLLHLTFFFAILFPLVCSVCTFSLLSSSINHFSNVMLLRTIQLYHLKFLHIRFERRTGHFVEHHYDCSIEMRAAFFFAPKMFFILSVPLCCHCSDDSGGHWHLRFFIHLRSSVIAFGWQNSVCMWLSFFEDSVSYGCVNHFD